MMIDKRLIRTVRESKKYIAWNVIYQWISLVANITMMVSIADLLSRLFANTADRENFVCTVIVVAAAVGIRYFCAVQSAKMGYLSSKAVKKVLREKIYRKLLRLGSSYKEKAQTSEIVQISVEGVEQLETYFGAYLPQFFYAMLAPLTLFIVLGFVNVPAAAVLLVCVPLIPAAIAAVQTWAKKLLSKYWGQYTALGDTFLENLQGLTTLKIYRADDFKNDEMNVEAEKFRKITMKVLTMQLNSITIMDLIAYGGAALGIVMSVTQYSKGNVSLAGCLLIIMLSADFFIPMRQLGSFFHIAMNGMAAGQKIFRLLDLPEAEEKKADCPKGDIVCRDLHFSYDNDREILSGVNMTFKRGAFIVDEEYIKCVRNVSFTVKAGECLAIVGESGCGKSTISAILTGRNKGYGGSVSVGETELSEIREADLMENITYISHQSYLFKGTVRDNLLMGKPDASDSELWEVLERVNLADFVRNEKGLDTGLSEKASNLSGGQCQRLALARALLHDSPIYIFDEATSNIDVESENDIMNEIQNLAESKTVILISHRLVNVVKADAIYVMVNGKIAESGKHRELLENKADYEKLWEAQQRLENYGKDGAVQ